MHLHALKLVEHLLMVFRLEETSVKMVESSQDFLLTAFANVRLDTQVAIVKLQLFVQLDLEVKLVSMAELSLVHLVFVAAFVQLDSMDLTAKILS